MISKIWHELMVRRPHGALTCRLLLPSLSAELKTHRYLAVNALPKLPRFLAWPALIWIRIRWTVVHALKASQAAVDAHGDRVTRTHGIDRRTQLHDVRRLAILHGIDPLAYYKLQFYLVEHKRDMWLFVHDGEVATFHTMRDGWQGSEGQAQIGRRLLSDKARTAEHCASLGLPVPPTQAILPAGSKLEKLPESDGRVLLCKPRSGSSARGIFRYRKDGDSAQVMTLGGKAVPADQAVDFVERRLAHSDYLVQPYLSTHDSLAHLGASATEAITVRIITERARIYTSFVEIPARSDDANGYCALAIDLDSGRIRAHGGPSLFVADDDLTSILSNAEGLCIPDWDRLKEIACAAHASIESIYAIAWDFVISNSGPILLEGNTAWGVATPQRIAGPLLADECNR